MSKELFWLAMTLGLTALFALPYVLDRLLVRGPARTFGNPLPDDKPQSAWAQRAQRAQANATENLVVFAPAVLAVQLLGRGDSMTAGACAVYFFARAAHYVVYVLGIPVARTLAWTAGWLATLAVIGRVLGVAVSRPLALVAGSGGVLGEALMQEFASAGYAVAGLRRGDCDMGDAAAVSAAIQRATDRHGPAQVLLYNAGHLAVAPFLEQGEADLQACWVAGAGGAANCARAVLPAMLSCGSGTLVFTGATASLRGSSGFAAMAAGKFALRGFAQALAREFQPQGIHVAHVVLDGLLEGSASAERFGARTSLPMVPRDVAAAYRWLVDQPRSAWTHELDLQPQAERF